MQLKQYIEATELKRARATARKLRKGESRTVFGRCLQYQVGGDISNGVWMGPGSPHPKVKPTGLDRPHWTEDAGRSVGVVARETAADGATILRLDGVAYDARYLALSVAVCGDDARVELIADGYKARIIGARGTSYVAGRND